MDYTPPPIRGKIVITKEDVERAFKTGSNIVVPADSVITPLAYDTAKQRNVKIIIKQEQTAETYRTKLPEVYKIAIGADHVGYDLKETLKSYIYQLGFVYEDFGTFSKSRVDYPDIVIPLAKAVAENRFDYGVMIDGAGIGSAIAANKIKGIRAAVCFDRFTAKMAREHSNANILTLGAMVVLEPMAKEILRIFLTTKFLGGRYEERLKKIAKLEEKE